MGEGSGHRTVVGEGSGHRTVGERGCNAPVVKLIHSHNVLCTKAHCISVLKCASIVMCVKMVTVYIILSLFCVGVKRLVVLTGAALSLVTTPHESVRGDPRKRMMTVSMATTDTSIMIAIIRIHIIESVTPAICLMKMVTNERRKDQRERSTNVVMTMALLRAHKIADVVTTMLLPRTQWTITDT